MTEKKESVLPSAEIVAAAIAAAEQDDYGAQHIRRLKGLEAVRVRPAMYIGDTGVNGLHHLFKEIIDNSVDEHMQGHCMNIRIGVEADNATLTVEDDGRGIPVEEHPEAGVSTLEVVLTELHAGGKFGDGGYGAAGGLHGVGASCVNALSQSLTARVCRGGGVYEQSFVRGEPIAPCQRIGDSRKRGTTITWKADPEIFTNGITIQDERIIRRCRELSFLNAGLRISYDNKATHCKEEFYAQGGIADYVRYLNSSREAPYPAEPVAFSGQSGRVQVSVAFQYTEEDNESLLCYANGICTQEGGTHLAGFKTGLTRVVNQFARAQNLLKEKDANLSGDDIRDGLTAIITVRLEQPQFEGQTKGKLGSQEAEGATASVVTEKLTEFFEKNPAILKMVAERAQRSQKAREAAKQASALVKRSTFLSKERLPGKLKDCDIEDRDRTEVVIVEGESAAGSAYGGRDPHTQAVLPLQGKIINVERGLLEAMKSDNVKSLIATVGTGVQIGDNQFDLSKLRYGKVAIMTDADDDGAHIAVLLMTFFFRYMRPLVENGHLYRVMPPLFKIVDGKKYQYAHSYEQMQQIIEQAKGRKSHVTRFKGLGEMNPDELAETCLDPTSRRWVRVTIEDAAEADRMLSILMGKNVAPRKAHILSASGKFRDLAGEAPLQLPQGLTSLGGT